MSLRTLTYWGGLLQFTLTYPDPGCVPFPGPQGTADCIRPIV